MLFNSFEFLLFFPIVTSLYFTLPHKIRWLLLLLASCYFYMAFVPAYILILAFTIIIDYFAGIIIENSEGKNRKLFLIISLISNVAILAFFKYYNFFAVNITAILNSIHIPNSIPYLSILLPIGLSFHTFQAMSYTIEVYRGNQVAEKHFGIYALYVMFYPQLVAGPIERPQNLLGQFYTPHTFEYKQVTDGLKLMAWGFFKKLVIADRVAIVVDSVYNDVYSYNLGFPFLIATILFAVQIYCDFSGYSDIAIGAAAVMGFKLMTNFKMPYLSKSVSEFWSRWHISLSTWFKDYVYFPLGGNRVAQWRWHFNLFIVFLVSGLWHGANWTYVIWGAINGIYLILEIQISKAKKYLLPTTHASSFLPFADLLKILSTFLLICLTWIFFRSHNVDQAIYIVKYIIKGIPNLFNNSLGLANPKVGILTSLGFKDSLPFSKFQALIALLSIITLFLAEYIQKKKNISIIELLSEHSLLLRWSLYTILLMTILCFGMFDSKEAFIYFQF